MKVDIIKSGKWAFNGVKVIEIKSGIQEIMKSLAEELIKAGWAEEIKEEEKSLIEENSEQNVFNYDVESVEKINAGWWKIKFKGEKEIKIRGAENTEEAITKAYEKIKVS